MNVCQPVHQRTHVVHHLVQIYMQRLLGHESLVEEAVALLSVYDTPEGSYTHTHTRMHTHTHARTHTSGGVSELAVCVLDGSPSPPSLFM